MAIAQVDSATVLVTEAEEDVQILEIAVEEQEDVVTDKTQVVESATAVVEENTTPGLDVTIYSNPGTAGSPDMGGTVVYTGTDSDGINEQWGGGGPTVTGSTTTTTETFNNNQLNTNIEITVNGTPVSTTNNSGVYIGSIGFPGPGRDPSLTLYSASADTLVTLPENTTSASFQMFAKNGDSTGTVTYSDGTTEEFILQHNVSSEYPNFVNTETFSAPEGKTISTILIPANWDYYAIDNVAATSVSTTTVLEDFQVKWEGLWTPTTTGTQYITAPADDGVRLYLDNELVIDDWFDKGGGGSTADVATTEGISKQFEMWYYENSGGAAVSLMRYIGSGWEIIPASEFSTSSATPEQIQTLQAAQTNLEVAQETLEILNNNLATSEENLTSAEENLASAQENLTNAVVAVQVAVEAMNNNVAAAQNIVVSTLAAEEAERARIAEEARQAEIARQAAIAAENARIAAQQAYEAEQARIAAEAAALRAQAEAKAAEEAAAQAEADRIAAEEAAAQAQAEAEKAEADRIAAEEEAAKAQAEAEAKAEEEAKAEAERLEAEAEAARQAELDAIAEAEAKEAEAEAARQAEEDAKAEEEAKQAELDAAKAEEEKAKAEEEKLEEIIEEAKDGKELTEEQKEVVVEALLEDLKPGEAVTAAAIVSSGVSFADLPPSTPVELRTDESGNTLVITAEVAANIELVQDPGALLEAAFTDPGAALAALGSIGADMTEAEREEATDMVVATVVATGAAINAAAVAAGGASGGSSGGGSSGGGSGSNSPGSRGGRRW